MLFDTWDSPQPLRNDKLRSILNVNITPYQTAATSKAPSSSRESVSTAWDRQYGGFAPILFLYIENLDALTRIR